MIGLSEYTESRANILTSPHSYNYILINLLEFLQWRKIYKGVRMEMVNRISFKFYLLQKPRKILMLGKWMLYLYYLRLENIPDGIVSIRFLAKVLNKKVRSVESLNISNYSFSRDFRDAITSGTSVSRLLLSSLKKDSIIITLIDGPDAEKIFQDYLISWSQRVVIRVDIFITSSWKLWK